MEILPIVNDQDEVIGQTTEAELYANNYLHRIVHVLIFNDRGEMALQKRSTHERYCPDHWSTAVGGHVHLDETYEAAAEREFKEELGVIAPFEFMAKDFYQPEGEIHKFLTTFRAHYNGPFNVNQDEVSEITYFPIAEIKQKVEQGEKFHPELLYLLKKYYF